ncbi:MAG TPA: DUF6596 domain-containing protein [Terriglobales bacterium]|nr:DUF6596 domain-containing protein [Terriglobales bacterium]
MKVRESQNGFTAIVQHLFPTSVEPPCMNAEATRTHLPQVLKVAELRTQGKNFEEIKSFMDDGFAKGIFELPSRTSVDYMLSAENVVPNDKGVVLCHEAMRPVSILQDHRHGSAPATHALLALMCLNAARLPARIDSSGDLLSLFDQDRSQWDRQLVSEGVRFLELSAAGSDLTEYHIEAGIAAAHAQAVRAEETDWKAIVSLYDTLLTLNPSPIVALNRAIAIAQNEGPERGLEKIQSIGDGDRLVAYPFYFAALGELELRCGKSETARRHFSAACALARNPMERRFLDGRIAACERDASKASAAGTARRAEQEGTQG